METYTFPCGCSFPIIGKPVTEGSLPLLGVEHDNFPEDCPAVWALLASGNTKGIFQLESYLGRKWVKRIKPTSIAHLAALGALLRPGCLDAKDEKGISMTEHYARRKAGEEEVPKLHPLVDDVLCGTYGVIVYQEDFMRLSQIVAKFDLKQVDRLRKSAGKKDAAAMSDVRKVFLEQAKTAEVIPYDLAVQLFDWIQASARYAFNRAHAYSYAQIGYETAYLKSHAQVQFFKSWLGTSDDTVEMAELVEDARRFDVPVKSPDVRLMNDKACTDGLVTYFGLGDVAGIGDSKLKKMKDKVRESQRIYGKKIRDWTWGEMLTRLSQPGCASTDMITGLISTGAFSWYGVSRKAQLAEHEAIRELTPTEMKWVMENWKGSVVETLRVLARPKPKKIKGVVQGEGGGVSSEKRGEIVKSLVQLLERPPASLADTPAWIAAQEEKYLGVRVSCSRVDEFDPGVTNTDCKKLAEGNCRQTGLVIAVEVVDVMEKITKNGRDPGRKMCSLTIADKTGSAFATVFPDTYDCYKRFFTKGRTLLLKGRYDRAYSSLTVDSVSALSDVSWEPFAGFNVEGDNESDYSFGSNR